MCQLEGSRSQGRLTFLAHGTGSHCDMASEGSRFYKAAATAPSAPGVGPTPSAQRVLVHLPLVLPRKLSKCVSPQGWRE